MGGLFYTFSSVISFHLFLKSSLLRYALGARSLTRDRESRCRFLLIELLPSMLERYTIEYKLHFRDLRYVLPTSPLALGVEIPGVASYSSK